MSASNYVHLEGVNIKRETGLAFLIEYEGEECWIPKSHVADADDYAEGDLDRSLSISEWIAQEKGLNA